MDRRRLIQSCTVAFHLADDIHYYLLLCPYRLPGQLPSGRNRWWWRTPLFDALTSGSIEPVKATSSTTAASESGRRRRRRREFERKSVEAQPSFDSCGDICHVTGFTTHDDAPESIAPLIRWSLDVNGFLGIAVCCCFLPPTGK